jgi:predicted RNA-binding Zn ribbon-like protein
VADDLSLDFANTAEWHAGPDPEEHLTSYAAAIAWAQEHGLLDQSQAEALAAEAGERPDAEAEALQKIVALREAVYRVFSAAAHGREPDASDLELVDRVSREGATHLHLSVAAPESGPVSSPPTSRHVVPRFGWVWVGLDEELAGFIWPVARAAADLLTSKRLAQLRECAGDPCGWLFLDESKNGSRRWCDMAGCGNRAKARRYRERKRSPAAGSL